jgi:hypothetical protein
MKLARVRLHSVRDLPDGEIVFTHPDGRPFDVAVVTGPAASGKTTLLEAIAMAKERVASYGRAARPRAFLRRGEANGLVELTLLLDEGERRRAGLAEPVAKLTVQLSGARDDHDPRLVKLLASYSHDPAVGLVDYFPANRRLLPELGAEPPPSEATEARLRLSNDLDKYRGVVPWLRDALTADAAHIAGALRDSGLVTSLAAPDRLAAFRSALRAMCPWLRLVGLCKDGRTLGFARDNGCEPLLFELSDAELDAVLLVASFLRVGHANSLVLIDRLDLHAHPDDQLRWLEALAALAPSSQLIVATTSERLLREIPAAKQIHLGRA